MPKKKFTKEIVLTLSLLTITAALFIGSLCVAFIELNIGSDPQLAVVSDVVFLCLIVIFAYGNFLYQLTRLGYYKRLQELPEASTHNVPGSVDRKKSLTVLVPSYKEESRTVEQTLWSAALLNYHNKQVVLLIDDPPFTNIPSNDSKIEATREITRAIQRQLDLVSNRFSDKYDMVVEKYASGELDNLDLLHILSKAYAELAEWLESQANSVSVNDHVDILFTEEVFYRPAEMYRKKANALLGQEGRLNNRHLLLELRHLANMMHVTITYFERKRYENLTHEPNKAMNINCYLSVMGKSFKLVQHGSMQKLLESAPKVADVTFNDSTYILTLDADSILAHTYADTLVRIMEADGNERIAVAQTPYSAIPGAINRLERIAGVTTDLQYVIHQGFSAYHAAYWVGANALLRRQALLEIAEPIAGQSVVRQFIQDRTVIEDTESSIDLVRKGWRLFNYPQRLAYSATPDDYGSLIIQRRRWANGGLIILPKLLGYLISNPSIQKIPEGFMRIHYLISIATVNIGLVVALFLPLQDTGFSVLVPLTSLTYFYLYYRDMRALGYSAADFFGVYALNLLLIPINLAGVFKSIQQLITRKKIPFGRTPKVNTRTAAQPLYTIAPMLLCCYLVYAGVVDLLSGSYMVSILVLSNAALLAYGIVALITLRAMFEDSVHGLRSWQGAMRSRLRRMNKLQRSAAID